MTTYAAVFKEAKKHLTNGTFDGHGSSRYICNCIEMIPFPNKVKERTRKIIRKSLGKFTALEDWLEHFHNIKPPTENGNWVQHSRQMQVTRHAWLDSLIQEFKGVQIENV